MLLTLFLAFHCLTFIQAIANIISGVSHGLKARKEPSSDRDWRNSGKRSPMASGGFVLVVNTHDLLLTYKYSSIKLNLQEVNIEK